MMCFIIQWLRGKVLSTLQPEGTTPMKWGIIVALYFSMFGNGVAMHMLFAFLPDMVKSFGISDVNAGYYVGLLASSLFLGKLVSSYFWGWLCDKIGRRKALLWCLGLLVITTLAFGFAKSFAIAFVIRFVTGVVAGIPTIVKAALTEICDDTNQPLGMSVIITAMNTGLIIGPAVGGYLSRPVDKYPLFTKGSLFDNFAYLLPCLVNSLIVVLSFILVYFKLPETLPSLKKNDMETLPLSLNNSERNSHNLTDNTSVSRRCLSKNQNELETVSNSKQNLDTTIDIHERLSTKPSLIASGSVSFLTDIHLHEFTSLEQIHMVDTDPYVLPNAKPKQKVFAKAVESFTHSKLLALCRDRNVRYSISVYTLFSFAVIAEHEMYSIWAASGKDLGGLSFDTNDLGFTLMVVGAVNVFATCIVFPRLVKAFGHAKCQYIMLCTAMFFTIICPATSILYHRSIILKIAVIGVLLFIRIPQGCCFIGQFIFIGNSVTSEYRASVHGLAMTIASAARSVAPTIAGSIFSWSVQSGLGFPFNEKCVFIFIGVFFWLSLVAACCLDGESLSKRRD